MADLKATRKGRTVTVVFELNEQGVLSSTGKSLVHFTTGGFAPLDAQYRINLTVIGPTKSKK